MFNKYRNASADRTAEMIGDGMGGWGGVGGIGRGSSFAPL